MHRRFKGTRFRRAGLAGDIGKGDLIGRDQAGARAAFNGHVAERHAPFHGERARRLAGIFDDITGAARRADPGDDGQRHVLRRDAERQCAADRDAHVFRFRGQQGLRGEHMLHFAGADAES